MAIDLSGGGAVLNNGELTGSVELDSGGFVYNVGYIRPATVASEGVMTNGLPGNIKGLINFLGASGAVENAGTLESAASGYSVYLQKGGNVVNSGTMSGVIGFAAEGYVGNAGYIETVSLNDGGTVANTGKIRGVGISSSGVVVNGGTTDTTAYIGNVEDKYGGATVTNFGSIGGIEGDPEALLFYTPGDTLIVEAGCAFNGSVLGGGGVLELANGKGSLAAFQPRRNSFYPGGDVVVSGSMGTTTFQNFGTLEIGKTAKFSLTGDGGDGAVAAGETLIDAGSLLIDNTLTVAGTLIVDKVLGAVRSSHFQTLAIEGGTADFNKGTKLTTPFVQVDGAASTVNVATNLTFQGLWTQSAGTVNVASGVTLTFDAPTFVAGDDSFAGTFAGSGAVGAVGLSGGTFVASGLTVSGARLNLTGATVEVGAGGLTAASGGFLTLDAASVIIGAAAGDTLTNDANILGAGMLGGGQLSLINAADFEIVANTTAILTIDTGAATIANAGYILSNNTGGITIQSAIDNTGGIYAYGGTVTANGAVTGSGQIFIDGGTFVANSAFNEAVTFTGSTGDLTLARSQVYTGTVTGFAHSTQTYLDLGDIGFVSAGEATFSGTSTGGTLTITDGTHTASIALSGNYLSATFAALSDGHGGTLVHLKPPPAEAPPVERCGSPHALVAAMAAMASGSGAAAVTAAAEAWRGVGANLIAPRCAVT